MLSGEQIKEVMSVSIIDVIGAENSLFRWSRRALSETEKIHLHFRVFE